MSFLGMQRAIDITVVTVIFLFPFVIPSILDDLFKGLISRFHIRRTRTAIVLLALSLSATPTFAQTGVGGLGNTATLTS